MTSTTGGAAFPQSTTIGAVSETVGGMTLRDWFAGQALAGLRANPRAWEELTMKQMIEYSWADADAMIQARGHP